MLAQKCCITIFTCGGNLNPDHIEFYIDFLVLSIMFSANQNNLGYIFHSANI